jgi:hypothetical protein
MSGVTKKYDRSYFSYENHIGVDRRHKCVRRFVRRMLLLETADAADPDYGVFNAIIPPIKSEGFVRDRFSKYFEVLSYTSAGLNGHQDLVVMRKRATAC